MAENASEIPRKDYYKLAEVCEYTDVQPYVVRFWESEFPQLIPERKGANQPLYRREHIDLVRRIKQLLNEEECTLAAARQKLGEELAGIGASARSSRESSPGEEQEAPDRAAATLRATERATEDLVPRQRYEDAIDEIDTLRLQLREADKLRRKAELAAKEAGERTEAGRQRARSVAARLENLMASLEPRTDRSA